MHGVNATEIRAQLTLLLRRDRTNTHPWSLGATHADRAAAGELIARYRDGVLTWCLHATRDAGERPEQRPWVPADELRLRLEQTLAASTSGPADLDDLTTALDDPAADAWRRAARAAALGEHDFTTSNPPLTPPQRRALLLDASDVTRAVVALDRHNNGLDGWQALPSAHALGQAAEGCSLLAQLEPPDHDIDHRGRHTRATTHHPTHAGLPGVIGAERDLYRGLRAFPTALHLRLALESQRIASHLAATHTAGHDPDLADRWATRAGLYRQLVQQSRDLGGTYGDGGTAAAAAAIVADRARRLTHTDLANPGNRADLDRLFTRIDTRIAAIIEHGADQRLYFTRLPLDHLDLDHPGYIKPPAHAWIPMDGPFEPALLATARDLRPTSRPEPTPQPIKGAAQSRHDLHAALTRQRDPNGPAIGA